jgi:cob(I)alamin adenosyltransferase
VKIYTKTGDTGETGLFGGSRISKASLRVDAYGDVDELGSVLGLARAQGSLGERFDELLLVIQSRLFDVGAELANASGKNLGIPLVTDDDIAAMEHAIDRAEEDLAPLRTFVLPGGAPLSAQLHFARTVCRRAERKVVALAANDPRVRPELVRYLNRLSDLLFVLARYANHLAGVADVPWVGRGTQKTSE